MLPYEFKAKIDHEVKKLENIDSVMSCMNAMLKEKNIPTYDILNKKIIMEDFCEHLFEIYVDDVTFSKVSFNLSVNIESYDTYIMKDDEGKYRLSDQPVGTFNISIYNPLQEPWTFVKQFNYVIGECK